MTLDLFEVPLDSRYSKLHHYPRRRTGVIYETWALEAAVIPVPPWREESTRQTFGNALSADWIPALRQAQCKLFAGMTGVSKGIPSEMTPPPDDAPAKRN